MQQAAKHLNRQQLNMTFDELLDVDVTTLSRDQLLAYEKILLTYREGLVQTIDCLKGKLADQQFGPQHVPAIRKHYSAKPFSRTCRARTLLTSSKSKVY